MDNLLTAEDVCRLLVIAPSTLYHWTMQNKIPHVKLSRKMVRFRESEILRWIENKSGVSDNDNGKQQQVVHKKPRRKTMKIVTDDIDALIDRAKKEVLG
ncbi:MAG: helix-turn-helix transcriptional regulator [Dissulfurispiraceae bacterium]